ncbi:MAG TPA: restriction endonuclease, partial [Deltaproteobacteria bacterium]|nr:restriction endonuclease [Deltaproteobacteria bacterium]
MTDAELPQPRELTVPTLRAVEALGGTASTVEINAKVVELLGLTDEQLAIEYGDDAIARGP